MATVYQGIDEGGGEDDDIGKPKEASDFSAAPNVKEERAGIRWNPKGGEFVVLSLMTDDYDGAIAADAPRSDDPSALSKRSDEAPRAQDNTLNEAVAMDMVGLVLERMTNKGYAGVGNILEDLFAKDSDELFQRLKTSFETRQTELSQEISEEAAKEESNP